MEGSRLKKELSKCSFCGFCEYVCPTYIISNDRIYGPRGRINLIQFLLDGGGYSKTIEKSLYTCLLCRACEYECPSNIKIVDLILTFRNKIVEAGI